VSRVKQIVQTDNAPKPIGPYSQAVRAGNLVFVSGQGPIDPKTNQAVTSGIEAETRQVMENLKAILEAAGSSLDRAVRCGCFLANLDDFQAFNGVYREYFTADPPARTTIQAARLPGNIRVEVDVIATAD
jgi:2-iminobutanoate/2-iminopropanoate deaminase